MKIIIIFLTVFILIYFKAVEADLKSRKSSEELTDEELRDTMFFPIESIQPSKNVNDMEISEEKKTVASTTIETTTVKTKYKRRRKKLHKHRYYPSIFEIQQIESSTLSPEEEKQADELRQAIFQAEHPEFTTTSVPPNPDHNGLLKDIGAVGVGFGIGVGMPNNDPVSVGTGVSVTLDESGPAGRLPPFARAIFPRQGEQESLNDYDGNKKLILSGKASKYYQAIALGIIKPRIYEPPKSLVGVNSGIGILGAQPPNG